MEDFLRYSMLNVHFVRQQMSFAFETLGVTCGTGSQSKIVEDFSNALESTNAFLQEAEDTVDRMATTVVEGATVEAVVETTTKEVENRLLFGPRALPSLGEGDVKKQCTLFFIKMHVAKTF